MGRGFVVLIAVAALAIGLLLWPYPALDDNQPATVTVLIDGPDGVIWSDEVTANPATALQALLAAGDTGNFSVDLSGPIGNRYVTAIDGHDETDGGGWCIQVNGEDSPISGDKLPVAHGDAVRWYWTNNQCDQF